MSSTGLDTVCVPIGRVRQVCRELAKGDKTQLQIAGEYGITRQAVSDIKTRYAGFIREWRKQSELPHFKQWIADIEQRLQAMQDDYELSASSDFAAHYEHIRVRTAILHEAAEQTGQLPARGGSQQMSPVTINLVGVDIARAFPPMPEVKEIEQ